MPQLSQVQGEQSLSSQLSLAKLLLIGDGKIGKTWYAALAAAQGFNVLYLDGDVGVQTIMHTDFPAEAREHIYLLNAGDRLINGFMTNYFHTNFVSLTTKPRFVWDDTKSVEVARGMDVSESEVWEIFPARLDANWVLIIDSWTALVNSCKLWASRKHGVDLGNTDTPAMRPVYQSAGNALTQFLVMIQKGLRCHIIVIAHPDEYAKYEKPTGVKVAAQREGDNKLLWTKLVPLSSSKPHSLTMAKYFTDVAWMEADRAGKRVIDYRLTDEKICGGHFDERKDLETYAFARLVERIGGTVPTEYAPIDNVIKIHPKGSYEIAAPATGQVLQKDAANADSPTPMKKGFAALAGLKKSG